MRPDVSSQTLLARLLEMLELDYPRSAGAILVVEGNRLLRASAPTLTKEPAGVPADSEGALFLDACLAADAGRSPSPFADSTQPLSRSLGDLAARLGFTDCWSVPILSTREEVFGSLTLFWPASAVMSPRDRKRLQVAAEVVALVVEQGLAAEELAVQALHDPLTGLPNRTLFYDRLSHAIATARRQQHYVACCYLDLDSFKAINDELGHDAGDEVLRDVARRLKRILRGDDTAARFGGDEFTVAATGLKDPAEAAHVARKVLDAFREPVRVAGREVFLGASLGISLYPLDAAEADALVRNADRALLLAKKSGKRSFEWFERPAVPEAYGLDGIRLPEN